MEHTWTSSNWAKTTTLLCAIGLIGCGRLSMNAIDQADFSLEEVCADRAADCSADDDSCDIERCEQELAAALCEPAYRDDGTETCVEQHLDDPAAPLHACDLNLIACLDDIDRDNIDDHELAAALNDCYERAIECRADTQGSPNEPQEPNEPVQKTCEQERQECIALVDGVDAESQEAGEQACRDMFPCNEPTLPSEPPSEPVCTTLESDDPLVDVFPGCQALYETCEANEASLGLGDNYCETQHHQCTLDNPPLCPEVDSVCAQPWLACLQGAQSDDNDALFVGDCQHALHACYMTGQWPLLD